MSSIPAPAEGSNKLTTPASFTFALADGGSYLTADFGIAAALPKTGISADSLGSIALALLALGGLAILATRRRKDGDTIDTDVASFGGAVTLDVTVYKI